MKLVQVVWNFPRSVTEPFGMYYFYWPVRQAVVHGHEAEVLTFQQTPDVPAEEEIDGIYVRRFPKSGGRNLSPQFLAALSRVGADVFYTQGYGELHSEATIAVARARRLPVIFAPYLQLYPWRRRLRETYDATLGRATFRLASSVIANTEYTAKHLKDVLRIPAENIAVIPLVARHDVFAHMATRRAGLARGARLSLDGDTSGPVILGVGQLVRRKGWEFLVRCLPRLVSVYPDVRVVIAGFRRPSEPNFPEELRALARDLGVEQHLVLHEDASADTLLLAYACADVMTHPSQVEAFGIVLIEAMSAALPVVAHVGTGLPDIVRDGSTGICVDVTNTDAYAQALARLLGDAHLSRVMGAAGLGLAKSEYSLDSVAPRFLSLCEALHSRRQTLATRP